jgi:HAD domain in Swiss Army Knife RNA repair proteins
VSQPILLLDVDGVLNPFPFCPEGFDEHDFFPEDDQPVRLARAHGAWLAELGEVFDVAWATGWGSEANRLLCPYFGLPEYPVVVLPPVPFEAREKVRAVSSYVGARRPAVWIDDDVTPDAVRWAGEREAPTFLVEVDAARGLTRQHVDVALRWANALGTEQRA